MGHSLEFWTIRGWSGEVCINHPITSFVRTCKSMPFIHGFLERITYYNEENDFLVVKLQEKGKRELTTIVGNLSGLNPGESLKLSGRWVHNKKFGKQFQVENYKVTVPAYRESC
ncbi:MAG: hypothetical protein A2157_00010 [Deltaproteobacteria bacterium RBG_16_47_11]|nr:MAG: hypothetical protein A2157_00010 [Deltaproteobacteria bacterium RBG_16_47_11]